MREKILVAYETRFGATRQSAELIGAVLTEVLETDVLVRRVRNLNSAERSLEGITHVVIGSSIAMGRWQRRALSFFKRTEFGDRRVAVFVSAAGILNEKADELDVGERRARGVELFVDPLLKETGVQPVAKTALGGRWKILGKEIFNNWEEAMVQGWAHEVAKEFSAQ